MNRSLVCALLVGIMWGVTNTCIRAGVLTAKKAVSRRSPFRQQIACVFGAHWSLLLSTPMFIVPQLANWGASACLVMSLADNKLHVATPVANAVSVGVTAATSQLVFQDCANLPLLWCGVLCVSAGAALCAV